MIELVVFDMAGTTVYDGDAVLHSLQAALPKRSWRLRSRWSLNPSYKKPLPLWLQKGLAPLQ